MSILLLQLGDVFSGEVIKRPSKHCKTPYVADVQLENGEEILGHSLSLGCCGLADKGSSVLMTCPTSSNTNKKSVCSHRIDLSLFRDLERNEEIVIGINPKLGENIAEQALKQNCIRNLTNIQSYTCEVKIMNSRFDFAGIDENGKPFVLEIKNVPLADYVDVPKKERNNYVNDIKNKQFNDKVAYFPDGYRKNSTDVVSPRALKHIQELEDIAKKGTVRAILCFIIQRSDANRFQTSNVDLIYKEAVYQAYQSGVEIKTIQVNWNKQGQCHFIRNDLPISLKNGEFISE
jgi:DNA-binding sugar fermentation-stimulating protein